MTLGGLADDGGMEAPAVGVTTENSIIFHATECHLCLETPQEYFVITLLGWHALCSPWCKTKVCL